MQGKAANLGCVVGGTPQFLEDTNRGLFSYEALRSRLVESRFAKPGLLDNSGPVLRLNTLTAEEIFVLLTRLLEVHAAHFAYEPHLDGAQIQSFMQVVQNKLGGDTLLTPREVIRDFIAVLNILQQNPGTSFEALVRGPDFKPAKAGSDPDEISSGQFAEFSL
jgi:hypothetical protein